MKNFIINEEALQVLLNFLNFFIKYQEAPALMAKEAAETFNKHIPLEEHIPIEEHIPTDQPS